MTQRTGRRQRLHMIGNAHLDVVWLWQQAEGLQEVKATFRSALDRLAEYPDFKFAASSAAYYEWIEQNEPAMFEEIRERVIEGRWALVGGWWVEPDCNLLSGESFARQALLGQRYFLSRFGRVASVGYNPDSFGHAGSLPQLLRQMRLSRYVFMRPGTHEKGLPARIFWWESDDGSRVLAHRIPFEYCSPGGDIGGHVERCAAEIRHPQAELMCFYGVGNHGGGPTRANIELIRRLAEGAQEATEGVELVFSTPEEFFQSIESSERCWPTVHDELQHHARGCYAAHSGLKAANRRSENQLLAAEKLSAVAARVTGLAYPAADLTRAWKSVLFNQFHDVLGGTSIEPACDDARDAFGEASAIAARAINQALQSIAWRIDIPPTEGSLPVVVFNPHSWSVKADIELESGAGLLNASRLIDDGGREVPLQKVTSLASVAGGRGRLSFVADLPALGYRVYRGVPGESGTAGPAVSASDCLLDGPQYRLAFDPESGFLVSLWDKRHGCEVLAGPGARGVVIEDPSDTWGHDVIAFQQVAGEFRATSVQLVEQGPVKSVVRVDSRFGHSRLIQDFAVYSELDHIEVRVVVDWRERRRVLKLRWPVNVRFQLAASEVPFGRVERPVTGEEEPGQGWIDLSGVHRGTERRYGLSVLNDAKYSYDVQGVDIGLTVLRSPAFAHHDPYRPDSWDRVAFMDQGVQRFGYTLLPHAGGWEEAGTVRRAAELNQRPLPIIETSHRGTLPLAQSFLRVTPESVVLSSLKEAEDGGGDLVLRCYETAGAPAEAHFALPAWERAFTWRLEPWQVKTLRIPRDPAAPVRELDLLEFENLSDPGRAGTCP